MDRESIEHDEWRGGGTCDLSPNRYVNVHSTSTITRDERTVTDDDAATQQARLEGW